MIPGIGGGPSRRRAILTPLERFGGDLWWQHAIGVSSIATESVSHGGDPPHLRATEWGDVSSHARHLLYPLDEQEPTQQGNRWPYYDADGGVAAGPRVYGGTAGGDHWLLRRAVTIPAGTELALWGVIYCASIIARVWACSGSSALDATGGRTGFAAVTSGGSTPTARFYTITDGGSQQSTDVTTTTGYHVVSIVYSAGQAPRCYLDGVLVATPAGTGGVAGLSWIGFGSTGTSANADGALFMGVGRAITEYEREQTGRWITQQYGLAA